MLVVLDVVQVYPFDPVAEVVLVYVRIAGQIEWYRHCFSLFETEVFKVSLVVELLLNFVENEA